MSPGDERFRVVIAGGGVAGLEAALALRELGGERIATTMIAPNPEFVYRPMTVREPFGYATAARYPLDEIARDIGVELEADSFKWLDPETRTVHTEGGLQLHYDALLLALGARLYPRYKHAITIDDQHLDQRLHGLIQDIEGGFVQRLAFVIPSGQAWPLPIYELALMAAARADDMNVEVSITIVTPEDAPLAIFGGAASEGVREVLEENGITTITSVHSEIRDPGQIELHPGPRQLRVDRVIALPELVGPSVRGLPGHAEGGFIPVDVHGQVRGLERVYAAGDATDFAIKFGGIAAQQADVAAQAIAAIAGVAAEPGPFQPVIHGMLLSGDKPRYLSAHVTGGHGSSSQVSDQPTWAPERKIVARYLSPFLEEREGT